MLTTKRKRSGRTPRAAIEPRCAVCGFGTSHHDPARRFALHNGTTYAVCGLCRKKYSHPVSQIETVGLALRFVKKEEVGMAAGVRRDLYQKIYKLLLLASEQQETEKKEKSSMVDEMTGKVLRLPGRIAAIVKQTYAVLGDDFKISEDVALEKIRDLLEDIDPAILQKQRKRPSHKP